MKYTQLCLSCCNVRRVQVKLELIPSREIYDIINRNIHMKRIIRKKQQEVATS